MRNTIPLKKNSEFIRTYRKGKFYVGRYLVLYALVNSLGTSNRLGITASRKVGKSVRRNRVRRLVRESYRLYEPMIETGRDLVFVIRENEVLPGYYEVKKEMKYLFKKLQLLKTGEQP